MIFTYDGWLMLSGLFVMTVIGGIILANFQDGSDVWPLVLAILIGVMLYGMFQNII